MRSAKARLGCPERVGLRRCLDTRLQARIDASDVVQEAYVEVAQRMDEYLRDPNPPFFLWLRLVVGERLMKLHRHHLGTQMRDAGREVSLFRGALPAASSAALAVQLLGRHTSPTQAVLRAERILRLQEALNALEPIDREVLSLRHFEELTAAETARRTGMPMTPPLPLAGKGLSVTVSPDSRRVVVGGLADALDIIDLEDLYAPDDLNPNDLCLWAEVLSGQRVHDAGGVTTLTPDEWLGRWQEFRRRHPGYGTPIPRGEKG